MGVYLRELNLVLRNRLPCAVKNNEARARGALVYRANEEVFQLCLVELLFLVVVYGRIVEIVTLGLGHRLWFCALCRCLLDDHDCAAR